MLLNPGVLALLLSSGLNVLLILYAGFWAARIVRAWDLSSGSEAQHRLEQRTYLISTLLSYAFVFQLVSLFLFIYTADSLRSLLVGAMCAAGTLYANAWGYPTLLLKLTSFLLAGVWLILNHTDNQAQDYPLIRTKYRLLLVLVPLFLGEAVIQTTYFLNLKADVITSCCGSLFATNGRGIAAGLASFPLGPTRLAFYAVMAGTLAVGTLLAVTGRGGYAYAILSAGTLGVSLVSLISFIGVYFYELPTHHCPFCILQKEYGYVGYPLYLSLLGGGVTGIGAGWLSLFRGVPSLTPVLPGLQRRLTVASLVFFIFFTALVSWRMVWTDFRP